VKEDLVLTLPRFQDLSVVISESPSIRSTLDPDASCCNDSNSSTELIPVPEMML